jgi:hypothetical protein
VFANKSSSGNFLKISFWNFKKELHFFFSDQSKTKIFADCKKIHLTVTQNGGKNFVFFLNQKTLKTY